MLQQWVLLVENEPVFCRAGNDDTYLLLFKDMAKARTFAKTSAIEGAQPRMVVRANCEELVRNARAAGVVGTLLDYDPSTQKYADTQPLS
jgi:hypothetical protein